MIPNLKSKNTMNKLARNKRMYHLAIGLLALCILETLVLVTLMPAKADDSSLRASENGCTATYWTVGIILILAIAAVVAKKRMLDIDHEAPEHRAKENELYEAFGLQIPYVEETPKNHEKKEEEVKEAFKHLKRKRSKHSKRF